eukprot:Blabericola_migrator_1__12299@NODE_769_length_6592_cov_104_272490_g547_i0_p6_GENE_NODE_769_length_6592_cov_104_272490_g547_i0NODE_769_length_6592_cov_104_272490_g547_i0_p6_ORF_typecomplete_len111_score0_11_NODE_769_length_6592_cov_104_272490_g547_i017672099
MRVQTIPRFSDCSLKMSSLVFVRRLHNWSVTSVHSTMILCLNFDLDQPSGKGPQILTSPYLLSSTRSSNVPCVIFSGSSAIFFANHVGLHNGVSEMGVKLITRFRTLRIT